MDKNQNPPNLPQAGNSEDQSNHNSSTLSFSDRTEINHYFNGGINPEDLENLDIFPVENFTDEIVDPEHLQI